MDFKLGKKKGHFRSFFTKLKIHWRLNEADTVLPKYNHDKEKNYNMGNFGPKISKNWLFYA